MSSRKRRLAAALVPAPTTTVADGDVVDDDYEYASQRLENLFNGTGGSGDDIILVNDDSPASPPSAMDELPSLLEQTPAALVEPVKRRRRLPADDAAPHLTRLSNYMARWHGLLFVVFSAVMIAVLIGVVWGVYSGGVNATQRTRVATDFYEYNRDTEKFVVSYRQHALYHPWYVLLATVSLSLLYHVGEFGAHYSCAMARRTSDGQLYARSLFLTGVNRWRAIYASIMLALLAWCTAQALHQQQLFLLIGLMLAHAMAEWLLLVHDVLFADIPPPTKKESPLLALTQHWVFRMVAYTPLLLYVAIHLFSLGYLLSAMVFFDVQHLPVHFIFVWVLWATYFMARVALVLFHTRRMRSLLESSKTPAEQRTRLHLNGYYDLFSHLLNFVFLYTSVWLLLTGGVAEQNALSVT